MFRGGKGKGFFSLGSGCLGRFFFYLRWGFLSWVLSVGRGEKEGCFGLRVEYKFGVFWE